MNIGNAIKLRRIQKDLSQAELAGRAGISKSYLSLIERNKRDPGVSMINNIADALDTPLFILVFLGTEEGELEFVSCELVEKMSHTVLKRC